MSDLTSAWKEIIQWPPRERLALATRILQSLEQESEAASVSEAREEALHNLIGIWKVETPPNEEEVQQILEEDRIEKYG